jgi:hypothetical protein
MSHRDIGRNTRLSGKRQTYHIRRDVIEAIGFRIEGEYRRFFQLLDPGNQLRLFQKGFIVIERECDSLFLRLAG